MNVLLTISLLLAAPAENPSEGVSADSIRETVARVVPFLEHEGRAWIEERKCVSCHQIPYMVWSLSEARRGGAAVDEEKLSETFTWAVDWRNWTAPANREKTDEAQAQTGNIDTMYQLILARTYAADDAAEDTVADWPQRFEQALLTRQENDGSWKACGQLPLQNRPARETTEVTTMWALLALAPDAAEEAGRADKLAAARKYLAEAKPGASSEWWAVRLLFERRFGSPEEAAEFRQQLLAFQHEDGGWGWLADGSSDALGAGIALFALSHESADADIASSIERAQRFLIDTQQDDGSWIVPSTLKRAKGGVKPTSTYWGAAWAVIGLVRTLPAT